MDISRNLYVNQSCVYYNSRAHTAIQFRLSRLPLQPMASVGAKTFVFAVILAMTILWDSTAAHAQYQVESWTTDNGLPQNTIHSILQTRDGYLWLTTQDGLVRYDGVRFTVFNKNNTKGINSNRFTQLIVDA